MYLRSVYFYSFVQLANLHLLLKYLSDDSRITLCKELYADIFSSIYYTFSTIFCLIIEHILYSSIILRFLHIQIVRHGF